MAHDRTDPRAVAPELYQAVLGLEQYVRRHVDRRLLHLVKLRASMVNGCAFCIDMHGTEAMEDGESAARLFGLAAWREAPFYDEQEQAALALTDAVTTLGEDGVPDDVWAAAMARFGEKGTVDLVGAIAVINVWNRLAISNRTTPLSARRRAA